jgi:hypothetical protein
MKVKYDEPLSNCAFNFNLRCYTSPAAVWTRDVRRETEAACGLHDVCLMPGDAAAADDPDGSGSLGWAVQVDSIKPESKARLISAIETKM